MTPQLRTAQELKDVLRLHPKTILRKARRKEIGCVRTGGKVLFSDKHVEDFLASHSQDAAPVQVPARHHRGR